LTAYQEYILGPVWAERRRRHLAAHPWCLAHGRRRGCRAQTVHHSSYAGWRTFGVEAPWELVSLCWPAHDRISARHQGRWISNVKLFALTWAIVGWTRLRAGRLPASPPPGPTGRSSRMVLSRPRFRWRVVAVAAAALALAVVIALAVVRPADAAPRDQRAVVSVQTHDTAPSYVSKSQPGGYELFGRHTKQVGATTNCSLGLQRRPSDGWYRWWGKCSGDGRPIVAIFSQVVVTASPGRWGPTTVATDDGPTVYKVGGWHPVEDLATVSAKVNVSYVTGRSTGQRCLDSYVIRRGQRAPWGNPRSGC
jgi:hypothetical protein